MAYQQVFMDDGLHKEDKRDIYISASGICRHVLPRRSAGAHYMSADSAALKMIRRAPDTCWRGNAIPSAGEQLGDRTIDRVADPAPAFASTTSVPAFWMRSVSFFTSSSDKSSFGIA